MTSDSITTATLSQPQRPPRGPRISPGDTIKDPAGTTNTVLSARGTKLLLTDPHGFQFILARHRIDNGPWQHTPRTRQPRRTHHTHGRVQHTHRHAQLARAA